MTNFESVGMEIVQSAVNPDDVQKKFSRSCAICCNRGLRIDCDRCAISATYKSMQDYFSSADYKLRFSLA